MSCWPPLQSPAACAAEEGPSPVAPAAHRRPRTVGMETFDVTSLSIHARGLGSGGLKKLGTGMLTLSDNATYLGDTTIDSGCLQLNGANSVLHTITGAGNLGVGNGVIPSMLTADSVQVGTLTIGAGSILTIAPIPGGPLAERNSLTSVPEPSVWAMLMLAAMGLGIYRCRCHCCIKSSLF